MANSNYRQKYGYRDQAPLSTVDRHHVLFEKRFWGLDGYCDLRQDNLMIVRLDRQIHEILHLPGVVPPVPPLGCHLTSQVRKVYFRSKNSAFRHLDYIDDPGVVGIALFRHALDAVRQGPGRKRISELEVRQIQSISDNLALQALFVLWNEEYYKRQFSYRGDNDVPNPTKIRRLSGRKIVSILEKRYGGEARSHGEWSRRARR